MSTALVTGGTSGIGLAFCRELAERGNDLVIVARHRARLENVSDELRARHSVNVEIMAADLSKRAALRRVSDRVADRDRPIDLLVNNAGFGTSKSFLKGDLSDEEAMLDVLCHAVLVLSHAGALSMKLAGSGVSATALCPGFTHTELHERANVDMSKLPKVMWLEADRLVRDCLDDVKAGKVLSVPGMQYKVIAGIAEVAPRALVRALSSRVASIRRPKR